MQLRYDEDLVENAVLTCASLNKGGPPALQISRYHRQREKLYSILDPDERNAAFFRLNLEWFREWGLEQRLSALFEEFPLIKQRLSLLVIRQARGRKDEGAELYVNASSQRNGVLAVQVQFLFQPAKLKPFVRHELLHLHDMLDPQFAYSPELPLDRALPQQQRLALERYRLIWDISIDGRLALRAKAPLASREDRFAEFEQAFCFWPEARRRDLFETLWKSPAPTHAQLVAIVADPRDLHNSAASGLGAPCPLCGFPTFDWAPESLLTSVQAAILAEFPSWILQQGACSRCGKIYKSRALTQVPAISESRPITASTFSPFNALAS